jgi:SAM-dependent methyltransferase
MADELYSEGAYLEKHPTWHAEDSAWKAGHIKNIISKNRIATGTVLEIGCGAGKILQELKTLLDPDTALTGIEISPQAYQMAIADNPQQIKFIKGGFEQLDTSEKYDIVMMIDVFEHVEDYYGFIRDAKPLGSKFIFHIPLDLSVQTVLRSRPLERKRKNLGHIHYFNSVSAVQTLEHAGYKIIDRFYTSSYTDLIQKSIKARLMKYPRKFFYSLTPEYTVRIFGGYSLMVLAE